LATLGFHGDFGPFSPKSAKVANSITPDIALELESRLQPVLREDRLKPGLQHETRSSVRP